MTGSAPRKTNWKLILITVGGVLIVGVVFMRGFWLPWKDSVKKLENIEEEVAKQKLEFRTFLKEKKRLERDRLLGLPPNQHDAAEVYRRYLGKLLDGWTLEEGPIAVGLQNTA